MPPPHRCADCRVIESTRQVKIYGETGLPNSSLNGAAGNGHVRDRDQLKHGASIKGTDIKIRFANGTSRVIYEARPPAWHAGEQVTVVDGLIHLNQPRNLP